MEKDKVENLQYLTKDSSFYMFYNNKMLHVSALKIRKSHNDYLIDCYSNKYEKTFLSVSLSYIYFTEIDYDWLDFLGFIKLKPSTLPFIKRNTFRLTHEGKAVILIANINEKTGDVEDFDYTYNESITNTSFGVEIKKEVIIKVKTIIHLKAILREVFGSDTIGMSL